MSGRRESQNAVTRCECGGLQHNTPTLSPWEFRYACERCKRTGTVSWAHAAPPPVYVPANGSKQGELF